MNSAFLPRLERATDHHIFNVGSGLGSFALFHDLDQTNIRINVADPGMTATHLSGGQGHSVRDGTAAILAFALSEPGWLSGTSRDRNGKLPW